MSLGRLHRRPLSSVGVVIGGGRCCVAVTVLVVSGRHTTETMTTYHGHGPVGLAPQAVNTANRGGVNSF